MWTLNVISLIAKCFCLHDSFCLHGFDPLLHKLPDSSSLSDIFNLWPLGAQCAAPLDLSPDSIFISLPAQNHSLPAFSIKGSVYVLVANYSGSAYILLLFIFIPFGNVALWIPPLYHDLKMQMLGPIADQSCQDLWEWGQGI